MDIPDKVIDKFSEMYATPDRDRFGEALMDEWNNKGKKKYTTHTRALVRKDIEEHLRCERSLGTFPDSKDHKEVIRHCVDIDKGSTMEVMLAVLDIYNSNNFKPVVYKSGGLHKYNGDEQPNLHIEVFFGDNPVSADYIKDLNNIFKVVFPDLEYYPDNYTGLGKTCRIPASNYSVPTNYDKVDDKDGFEHRFCCFYDISDMTTETDTDGNCFIEGITEIPRGKETFDYIMNYIEYSNNVDWDNLSIPDGIKSFEEKNKWFGEQKEPDNSTLSSLVERTSLEEALHSDTIPIRHCIKEVYKRGNQLQGSSGHYFRQIVARELINAKTKTRGGDSTYAFEDNENGNKAIASYFSKQTDFNLKITLENIDYMRKNYSKPFRCQTIRNKCPFVGQNICPECPADKGMGFNNIKNKKARNQKRNEICGEDLVIKSVTSFDINNGEIIGDEIFDYSTEKKSFAISVQKQLDIPPGTKDKVNVGPYTKYASSWYDKIKDILYKPYEGGDFLKKHKNRKHCNINFADYCMEYGSPEQLYMEINDYIEEWVTLPDDFRHYTINYILFSYFFDAFPEVPYLRFQGDTGTGKSRAMKAVGWICYHPVIFSGGSSPSVIYRTLDSVRGSMLFEEADLKGGTEACDTITKVLNCGFDAYTPFSKSEKGEDGNWYPRSFEVFGPVIMAMRESFEDDATENRTFTQDMNGITRESHVQMNFTPRFFEQTWNLRNKLQQFRFDYISKMDFSDPNEYETVGVEDRTNQISGQLLHMCEVIGLDSQKLRRIIRTHDSDMKESRTKSLRYALLKEIIISFVDAFNNGRTKVRNSDFLDRFNINSAAEGFDKNINVYNMGHINKKNFSLAQGRGSGAKYYLMNTDNWERLRRLATKYGMELDNDVEEEYKFLQEKDYECDFKCPDCRYEGLIKHLESKVIEQIKCPECGYPECVKI